MTRISPAGSNSGMRLPSVGAEDWFDRYRLVAGKAASKGRLGSGKWPARSLYRREQAAAANQAFDGFQVAMERAVTAERADVLAHVPIGRFRAFACFEWAMELQALGAA